MTGEAIEALANLIERRFEIERQVVRVPQEPADVYFLVGENGTLERHTAETLPVRVNTLGTSDLLRVCRLEQDRDEACDITLYCAPTGIAAVVESTEGRIRQHTLPLALHPVFARLESMVTSTPASQGASRFSQAGLITLLRAQLNNYVPPEVVELFRHLKLSASSDGESVVAQGHEGLSRSVRARITTKESAVPDEIMVSVPVYNLHELADQRSTVRVLVDCAPDDEGRAVFYLTSIYSDLEDARMTALSLLAERLSKGDYPVIFGSVAT